MFKVNASRGGCQSTHTHDSFLHMLRHKDREAMRPLLIIWSMWSVLSLAPPHDHMVNVAGSGLCSASPYPRIVWSDFR